MCSKCAPRTIEAIEPAERFFLRPRVVSSPRTSVRRELPASIPDQEDNGNENHIA